MNTLRLIASQYIDDAGLVNYEKVLSFISATLKEANTVRPVDPNPPRCVSNPNYSYMYMH